MPLMIIKDGESQEDVKKRVGKGLKTFCAIEIMFKVGSVSLGVIRELFERVLAQRL